jgi:hypothetical protein
VPRHQHTGDHPGEGCPVGAQRDDLPRLDLQRNVCTPSVRRHWCRPGRGPPPQLGLHTASVAFRSRGFTSWCGIGPVASPPNRPRQRRSCTRSLVMLHRGGVVLVAEPRHVIWIGHRFIPRRVVRPLAGRHAFHPPIVTAIHEERDGIAILARAIDDAMGSRKEPVIRPAPQQVSAIDQKRAGQRRCIESATVWQSDRKAGDVVLSE